MERYNGEIRVCTCGGFKINYILLFYFFDLENEQLSIGNPLGTSKRKFVSFDEFPRGEDPPPNIRIKQVSHSVSNYSPCLTIDSACLLFLIGHFYGHSWRHSCTRAVPLLKKFFFHFVKFDPKGIRVFSGSLIINLASIFNLIIYTKIWGTFINIMKFCICSYLCVFSFVMKKELIFLVMAFTIVFKPAYFIIAMILVLAKFFTNFILLRRRRPIKLIILVKMSHILVHMIRLKNGC